MSEPRKIVPLIEGNVRKGGRNPPNTSTERPPPPKGSGGKQIVCWSTLPASEQERLGRVVREADAPQGEAWERLGQELQATYIRIARAVWEAAHPCTTLTLHFTIDNLDTTSEFTQSQVCKRIREAMTQCPNTNFTVEFIRR